MFQIPVPKVSELKRRLLIEFFINHFRKVAKKCYEYESYKYSKLILEHCRCLAILLGEEPSGELEARPLKRKISAEILKCEHKMEQIIPRVKPTRQTRGVKFDLPNFNEGNTVFERKNRPKNIKLNEINSQQPRSENNRPESYTIVADVHESNNNSTIEISKF